MADKKAGTAAKGDQADKKAEKKKTGFFGKVKTSSFASASISRIPRAS